MLGAEVIIVGGGFAGLAAAIYLGRARRDVMVIDAGKSMGRWEHKVENYLGFPEGISGRLLLGRARRQACQYDIRFKHDFVLTAGRRHGGFLLEGKASRYRCRRLLLATGIFHVPPEIPGVRLCLGHSMFFCKDCDGLRVQGCRVGVYGCTNDAAEYALALLTYTPKITLVTNGHPCRWDEQHALWLKRRRIPFTTKSIRAVRRSGPQLQALVFDDHTELPLEALFTMRGDVIFNSLARDLGAPLDVDGQVITDTCMRAGVPGLYASGCLTTGNCQMIIAAGQGATAAQTINRELFFENLAALEP